MQMYLSLAQNLIQHSTLFYTLHAILKSLQKVHIILICANIFPSDLRKISVSCFIGKEPRHDNDYRKSHTHIRSAAPYPGSCFYRWTKRKGTVLLSILALGGMSVSTIGTPLLTVQAAEEATVAAKEYHTQGGIANMGSSTANITIKGNEGQTLVGKKFHVYKLFLAQNAQGMESINYTFNPTYEQALKNVAAKALSVPVDDVTEYMVIDYIQSLNSYKVEGAQTEQELEGRYSKFRYFVEDLRNEIEKQGVQSDVVNIKDIKSDNSVQLTGLEFGYYLVDEITDVEGTHSAGSLCMVSTANPSAEMQVKSDYPSVIKKIQEDDQNPNLTDPDGWNDIGDYEIGQTVPYKYESNIPNMNGYKNYYYAWHDKMDKALTFKPESVKITISDEKGKATP